MVYKFHTNKLSIERVRWDAIWLFAHSHSASIIYYTFALILVPCIVSYIKLFSLFTSVHNLRIAFIFKTHRERLCPKLEVWDQAHSHPKSHPIPIQSRPLDHLTALFSFVARCVCMEIFFIINAFIHSHSLIRMWQEVSEWQWVKGWVRGWGARPATRLTVGFVWLALWILNRSVLCECDRIIYY